MMKNQYIKSSFRVYFRKAGHACGMNGKGHILVILGQFEDETFLNNMQI